MAAATGTVVGQKAGVAELVGKLEWAEPEAGRAIIEQLLKLGADAIRETARMLKDPGEGKDATARFALHGLAMHVVTGQAEQQRNLLESALIGALEEQKSPEIKAFLVRQLQLVGRDAAVPALARYLSDDRFCEPAA